MAGDDLTANPPWLARIDHPDGWVLGAGFLIDETTVLTCGHTVPAPEPGGSTPVEVRFVHSADPAPVPGRVAAADHHLDVEGPTDLAVVRLEAPPPPGTVPAPLVGQRHLAGHHVVLTGFPEVPGDWGDQGEWGSRAEAVVSTQGGPRHGWWELLDRSPGPAGAWVAEGFSGGPVWSTASQGVVGMTVAASESRRQAYALPLEMLVEAEPTLRLRVQPPPDDADVEADLRDELAALEARLPAADPRLPGARFGLAITLLNSDRDQDETARLLEQCIADVEAYDHPPARTYGMWLALTDLRLGQRRDVDAGDALARARRVGEAAFGADDPRLVAVVAREGIARLQIGDVAGADAAARRAQRLAGGGVAEMLAEALFVRAQVAASVDPGEAERLTKRLYELGRRVLPPEHPALVRPTLLRGHSLAALGEREAARARFDEALALADARYSRSHGEVADCRLALAQLDMTERPGTSLDAGLRALDAGEQAFRKRPPRLVPYLLAAASARHASGDLAEAFALADRAVEIATAAFGDDHLALIEPLAARAQTWPPETAAAESVADAERVHAIARDRAPDVVPVIVPALTLLAGARLIERRPDDAAEVAARAVALVDDSPFARLPVAAAAERALGLACYHRAELDASARHLTAARRIYESFFGTSHLVVGQSYLEVSECERRRGDTRAAEAARTRGLAILDEALPPGHPQRRQLQWASRAATVTAPAERLARWFQRRPTAR